MATGMGNTRTSSTVNTTMAVAGGAAWCTVIGNGVRCRVWCGMVLSCCAPATCVDRPWGRVCHTNLYCAWTLRLKRRSRRVQGSGGAVSEMERNCSADMFVQSGGWLRLAFTRVDVLI